MSKNVDTIYPATPLQHGMLHHTQQDPGSGVYVEQFACVFSGRLDVAAFRDAWNAVVNRHDSLKTLFIRLQEPQPLQVVRKQVELPFEQHDWRGLDPAGHEARLQALLRADRERGFDPSVAPLARVTLVALADERHQFLWSYHHAVLDGWSLPVLFNEVFKAYAGLREGRAPREGAAFDYRRYVAWLRTQDAAASRAFWQQRLQGLRTPVAFAPATAPQPAAAPARRRLESAGRVMPPAWTQAATALCRAQRITLNTLCQGAWAALLGLYADSEDVAFGMVVSGRAPELSGIDHMVGLFINTLPSRVTLDGSADLVDWLHRLQAETVETERYAYTPLAEALQCASLPRGQALFDSLYVFENYPGQAAFRQVIAANGLAVDDIRVVEETNYALALIVVPTDTLQFHLTYDTARFTAAAVERMVAQYAGLLEQMVEREGATLDALRLQPAPPTVLPAPAAAGDSFAARIAAHAARAPSQPACGGLDYATLSSRIQAAAPDRHRVLRAGGGVQTLVQLLAALAAGDDAWLADDGAPDAVPAAAGPAIGLLARDGDAWTRLRYDEATLLQAADAFIAACPVRDGRDVPLLGDPASPANLWTALFALAGGLSLHELPGDDLPAAAAGRGWHSLRLDAAQTRRLAGLQAPAATATHWIVDTGSLTAQGEAALRRHDAAAALHRELRWPALALPQAWADGDAPRSSLGAAWPGTRLAVLDRNLRPAAVDACGRLALLGAGVAGQPQALPSPEGAMLLTSLRAWRDADGCHAMLPCVTGVAAPGALERELAQHPGVRELALVERLDERGEWMQALCFVAAQDDGAAEIAARLNAACPGAAVIELAELPRHRGGIDRLALARGPLQPVQRRAYVAPRDEIEVALHTIWCALLKRERIGVDDDYFDLGGQSLLASVMLFQIEEKLGAPVELETLLANPTIAGLAQAIKLGVVPAERARPDLAKEAALAADIVPASAWQAPAGGVREIFLTGATGFLGAHLLAELLARTGARVHCLVRAADAATGQARLAAALQSHGLWQPEHAPRIVAVPGELDKPLFGLSAAAFDALAREIDCIYHNGAMVNFVFPYSALKAVNVSATQDVLRLACLHRAKPVHYVSTMGVLDRTADAIPEALAVPLHDTLVGGYEQSKWVAEQLVVQAAQRGLPVAIYRPSRILGHSRTGRMNTDDLWCRLVKGIVAFGKAPQGTGYDNMLPVDLVSRIVVDASMQPAVHGQAVHVINPRWTSFDSLLDFIEAQGHPVQRLGYDAWLEALAAQVRVDPAHPLAVLMPVLKKLNPVADPSVGRRMPIAHDNLDRLAADALREGLAPDAVWLRTWFEHLYASGNLPRPAPREAAVSAALATLA